MIEGALITGGITTSYWINYGLLCHSMREYLN